MLAALKSLRSQIDSIFCLSPDAIVIGDINGIIRRVNPAVTRLSGFREEELIGQPAEQFAHPEDLPKLRSGLKKVFQGEMVEGYQIRALVKHGDFIWQEWNGVLLDNGAEFLSIGRDLTRQKNIEAALIDSEARFRRLAENAADMLYRMVLPEGRYEYVSPASSHLFGYSPEEFYWNPLLIREVLHPDWQEYFQKAWAALLDGRVPPTYEYQIIHKSGEVRWLNQRNVLVRDTTGRPVAIEGVVTDITDRKRAEDAARSHAGGYTTLLATSHDGFLRLGRSGRILETNDAYSRMSGFTPEELLRLRIFDLEAQESQADTERHIQQLVETGYERFESRHRAKDGTIIDVEVSSSYWATHDQMLAFIRDITERRRAQTALKAERHRFNGILDALPLYLVLLTTDFRVAFANRYVRERFGEPGERHCFELLFDRSEPCKTCRTYQVLNRPEPVEWHRVGRDGRDYYVYDFPFTDTDGSTLVLEAGLDITDLQQAEAEVRQLNATLEQKVNERTTELAAVNKELESFAYSVSHDLRGPLRAINGFSEIFQEDYGKGLDPIARSYLERISTAAEHMNDLIDGLLTLSRVMRGQLRTEPVNLSTLAEALIKEMSEVGPKRCVEWHIDPGLVADGDPTLIRILLQNLVDNALKYTARGKRALISVGEQWQGRQKVFYVKDNGIGFEEQYARQLFHPFERLHANGEYEGSGIGLATVQRIVHRHGGEVWAEGAVDQGAIIFFTLPSKSG
ncbi:PAS domain-containing sensor histidine kinase [Thiohalomonas denitrificans]|uniref:histidine kinase n=1 Tax=Thiohalomonas denitrificans TaxID=415747 RepID=A0A1G5QXE0_9GAMM|nr:PAS domain S-box protein [Thiohalomonas denitrificans]SCZ66505.1 PAS domain-containing protein [Thiohalomonas denitrificans]